MLSYIYHKSHIQKLIYVLMNFYHLSDNAPCKNHKLRNKNPRTRKEKPSFRLFLRGV